MPSEDDGKVIDLADYIYEKNKEQIAKCDHGVKFDLEEAKQISTLEVRKRFPRLYGPCPKGCGYNGIAYASTAHYVYGDW